MGSNSKLLNRKRGKIIGRKCRLKYIRIEKIMITHE